MSITRRYFSRRRGLAEFISAGPLAPIIADLAAALEAKGYSACTIHSYVRSARHVTYAIEHHQLARRHLTLAGLRAFAQVHGRVCRCPHPETRSNANFYCCMPHLLPILRRHGLAAEEEKHPFGDVLAEFDTFMDDVKGLTQETRGTYLRTVRRALSAVMHDGRFKLKRLTLSALQLHVTDVASRHSPYAVHRTVTAIRALLRFLQTRGVDTAMGLTMIKGPRRIPPLASQKSLTVAQTRALLAPLRGIRDPLAMRNLAIMLLLCQVGLRRGDVPKLQLADFHARTSTLIVSRGKSRRALELPVPDEARDAVLRYVRFGRPATGSAALFIGHGFPYDRGITVAAVSDLVMKAFRKSGVKHSSTGAHVLRHTLATQLVTAMQPLKAVADVMRHKSIDTTAGYVRTDLCRLRAAVSPWPKEHDGVYPGTA